MEKLRIGILGAGHLGKFHIQQSKEIESLELVGFYDPDPEKVILAEKEFNQAVKNKPKGIINV